MWSAQAEAEGLTLLVAENKAGYFGVHLVNPGQPKPYLAQLRRGGNMVHLGCFATAEEAALFVARSPEGQAAAARAAAAALPRTQVTREQALQQAQAEGITLRKADNKTGFANVTMVSSSSKPYLAQVWRGGKPMTLGTFATAEEAALCVARSPEGQAAAARAAAAPPPTTGRGAGGGSATVKEFGARRGARRAAPPTTPRVAAAPLAQAASIEGDGAAGVTAAERSADSSGRPAAAAAATRSSSATSSATADPAPRAADDSVEEQAWRGSVRTPEEAQCSLGVDPLSVGHSVEAHFGRLEVELWWPAVVTKVRYHAHCVVHAWCMGGASHTHTHAYKHARTHAPTHTYGHAHTCTCRSGRAARST